MNRLLCLMLSLLLVVASTEPAHACTSFAVFSSGIYYGMNFDILDLPIKFLISANGDIRTFHLAFERVFGDLRFFVNTAGMNTHGLFAACQEMVPANDTPPEKTDSNMFTFELYEAINTCRTVDQIRTLCTEKPIIDMEGITLHNLFADTTGRAMVTEAGEAATALVENNESFLVMTNFPNQSLKGRDYSAARGKGDRRYKRCHEYLREHAPDFSVAKGLELLSLCRNKDPNYPTVCHGV